MQRRQLLKGTAAALALLQAGLPDVALAQSGQADSAVASAKANGKGRLKQSVARWCFADIAIEDLCKAMQQMGVTGMDLVAQEDWATCRKYGITPCMILGGGGGFQPVAAGSTRKYGKAFGWDKVENHKQLISELTKNAAVAATNNIPNIIGLFGDRDGMSDEQGIRNCVAGLKQVAGMLEKNKVTLAIEVLNSLVDHPDYIANNTRFGVEVCRQVGSERVKLVYDAYHMQIMEGNLISTIRQHIDYIAHFHVAGVPGRNEIDERQEVNWKAVAKAIADLNFQGYIAHEWVPTGKDPLGELRKAVQILTV